MTKPLVHQSSHPSDCGCASAWRKPKPNGTCATCGGWLPGERPRPLPWTHSKSDRDVKVWTYFGNSPAMLEDQVQDLIDRGGEVLSLAIGYGPSPAKAAGLHGEDSWAAMVVVDIANIDPEA